MRRRGVDSDCRPTARSSSCSAAAQGARTLNEIAVAAWGAAGPAVLHLCGERDYDELRDRVTRADYRLLPFIDDFGAALGRGRRRRLARRRVGLGDRRGRPARDSRAVPARNLESSGEERRVLRARGRCSVVVRRAGDRRRVPQLVAELLADLGRLGAMSDAMRAAAKPDAADRIADELVALAAARR